MKSRSGLVVLLGSEFHIRSFFAADLFKQLEGRFKLTIAISDRVSK